MATERAQGIIVHSKSMKRIDQPVGLRFLARIKAADFAEHTAEVYLPIRNDYENAGLRFDHNNYLLSGAEMMGVARGWNMEG